MSESLEKLFSTTDAKEFAKLFSQLREEYREPQAFLAAAAAYLGPRLYQNYYDESFPSSLFGLANAPAAEPFFEGEEERWKPYAQQAWLAALERKRSPWDLSLLPSVELKDPKAACNQFQQCLQQGQVLEAAAWLRGFLETESLRRELLVPWVRQLSRDSSYSGHKLVYFTRLWELVQGQDWKKALESLFPFLHFLALAPRSCALSQQVQSFLERNPISPSPQGAELSEEEAGELEQGVLFADDLEEALQAVARPLGQGRALASLEDALSLTGVRAVTNARGSHWVRPLRAFHFLQACRHRLRDLDPQQHPFRLLQAAALIHEASRRTREGTSSRVLDEVARRLCPTDPFNVLRSVVSHSDPYASATAAYAILGMEEEEKRRELFSTLMSLAVKNDPQVANGYDILFIAEVVDCFRRSRHPSRDDYLAAAAFFLGRLPKSYQLSGAL